MPQTGGTGCVKTMCVQVLGEAVGSRCACMRAHPDLNQGPADLRSAALTTELCTQLEATAALHLIAFWNVDPLAQDGCLFAKFEANP